MNPSQDFELSFAVDPGASGSLVSFLKKRLVEAHALQLPDLLAAGSVRLDGGVLLSDVLLSGAEVITVRLSGHIEAPVNTDWQMLWQNHELMAVYKPHLLPVSRTTRNLYNTLISLVRRQTPYHDARLLHRLDTETAGVILLAKDRAADRKWKPRLEQLITRKIYHAWVNGIPKWIDKEFRCKLSEKAGSEIRSRVFVVDDDGSDQYLKPRDSMTAFRVLQSQQGRTLVECELYTGRKHQIRSQLAYLGFPVIGDKIYSRNGYYYLKRIKQGLDSADFQQLGGEYHLLEAVECVLNIDGSEVRISAEPS